MDHVGKVPMLEHSVIVEVCVVKQFVIQDLRGFRDLLLIFLVKW
jgi:hypothetical protein